MAANHKLSRRQVLAMSFAFGGIVLPFSSVLAQTGLRRTPDQVLGPFYPVTKPLDRDADLTSIQGKPGRVQGQVIHLMGHVLDLQGHPVPGARVEIWQANMHGRYTHLSDTNPAPLDPNFEGFGMQVTDAEGRYRFKTVKPGAYPVTSEWMRPPHVHFEVTGQLDKLVTQMYFAGEALNDRDRYLQGVTRKEALIAKLLPPTQDLEPESVLVSWDIVLPRG